MTTSKKWGIAIVFASITFLFVAFFGLLAGLIAVCLIAFRLMWCIGVLYVIAYIKRSRNRKRSNTLYRHRALGFRTFGWPYAFCRSTGSRVTYRLFEAVGNFAACDSIG